MVDQEVAGSAADAKEEKDMEVHRGKGTSWEEYCDAEVLVGDTAAVGAEDEVHMDLVVVVGPVPADHSLGVE